MQATKKVGYVNAYRLGETIRGLRKDRALTLKQMARHLLPRTPPRLKRT